MTRYLSLFPDLECKKNMRSLFFIFLMSTSQVFAQNQAGSSTQAGPDPLKIPPAIYKDGQFHNLYDDDEPPASFKRIFKFIGFLWGRVVGEEDAAKSAPYIQTLSLSNAAKNNTDKPSVTLLGHASTLFQMDGVNVLADPIFSQRASPVSWAGPKRYQDGVITIDTIDQLPKIDIVIISHDHYDHLDKASVLALNAQKSGAPIFLVGKGLKTWFEDIGVKHVLERDWGESYRYKTLNFTFTPAQHWAKRSLWSRNEHLWGSWFMAGQSCKFYFAGDTAYAPHFKLIENVLGKPDVAVLPVGAYEPREKFKYRHMNPLDSVKASMDLQASVNIGMHWATFALGQENPIDTPKHLSDAKTQLGLPQEAFILPAFGETKWLSCQQKPW